MIALATDLTEATIDTENLCIKDVVLLGSASVNAKGKVVRKYSDTCMQNAVAIFEGMSAYMDHPKKEALQQGRSIKDMFGTYRRVRVVDGKLKGDLELFDSPNAHHVMAVARKNPQAIGNSINASGRTRMQDGIQIVEEIFSRNPWGHKSTVDLVEDPATAQSLFEETQLTDNKENTMEYSDITKKGLLVNCTELVEEIQSAGAKSRDAEVADLLKKNTALLEEKKGIQAKLDEAEVTQALLEKRSVVDELLDASELPEEAKTPTFHTLLLETHSTAKTTAKERVEALIEDRMTLIRDKSGVRNTGGHRQADRKGTKKESLSQTEILAVIV